MLKNKEGTKIPSIKFKIQKDNKWHDITTDDIFTGKNVIVFGLPGAFTPTCSSAHLPRYNELASVFKENNIDDIVCVSVNDTFVMNAWSADQEAENIRMLPDGNGEFTEAVGMLVDKGEIGFGKRSWRYSMLVKDNVIDKMFIEPEKPGDPFEVSDADTMLKHINPQAKEPSFASIFTKTGCPHCTRAKNLLDEHNIAFEELVLGKDASAKTMHNISGAMTTPQIFLDGKYIGGADELSKHLTK